MFEGISENMKKPNWLVVVLAVLSSGLITGLATDWFGYRTDVDTQFSNITKEQTTQLIVEMKEDRDFYKESYRECKIEVDKLLDVNNELLNEVRLLKTSIVLEHALINDLPADVWIKDKQFRMTYVNKHYEKTHLAPRNLTAFDYIGKTDFEIWDSAIAEGYRRKDIKGLKSKEPLIVVEIVPDATTGLNRSYKTISFPRKLGTEVIDLINIGFFLD